MSEFESMNDLKDLKGIGDNEMNGKRQCVDGSDEKTNKNSEGKLDIVEFNDRFNDDVFRLVLSFLSIRDLGRLERVSKKIRLCQLCGEDSIIWMNYYEKKVKELNLIMERSHTGNEETMRPYLDKKNDFKNTTTMAIAKFNSIVEDNTKKKMDTVERIIEGFPEFYSISQNHYERKEELCNFDISKVKQEEKDVHIKVLALGDTKVGKTSLMMTLLNGEFPKYIPTVMDNYLDNFKIGEETFQLCFWDSVATSDDFPRIRVLSYPHTKVFLAIFSCVDHLSFEKLFEKWIPEVSFHCPKAAIILVATKIDLRNDAEAKAKLLERYLLTPISYSQGERAAILSNCFTYVETSALKNDGFSDLIELCIKAHLMNISNEGKEKKKCCLQ